MTDLDPSQATSLEDLAECLRQLRLEADRPALRILQDRTIHKGGLLPGSGLKRVPLRRTTLSQVLSAQTFPRKAFLLTLVEACGVNLETDRRWEQAWNRLAPRYLNQESEEEPLREHAAAEEEANQLQARAHDAEAHAAQAEQRSKELAAEVDRLRQQLAASYAPKLSLSEAHEFVWDRAARVLPKHPNALAVRTRRARAAWAAGDAAAARDQYAALLPDCEQVLGPKHPDCLIVRADLARTTGEAGDPAAARDQLAALLPLIQQVIYPGDPGHLRRARPFDRGGRGCGRGPRSVRRPAARL